MDAENDIGPTYRQDTQVSGKCISLDLNHGIGANRVTFNLIPVPDKDTQGEGWLWSEAQMTNKAILHKIVRAATVYEDEDDMVRHLAKETECFRRRVARQGTKSYLGLGLFGLV